MTNDKPVEALISMRDSAVLRSLRGDNGAAVVE